MQELHEAQDQAQKLYENLSNIKYKIAVLSGKGGVGKSTITVNLAALLSKHGERVGILDADVCCPNIGKLFNIDRKFIMDGKNLIPIEKYGIRLASMSFFDLGDETPTIWRGPLIHNALMQMLTYTEWGELDYLIIDMPPGTSDETLTIMQSIPLDAISVVTTSQELSLMDAVKSANMAKQFHTNIGIVENMSGDIFGTGGGMEIAKKLKIPFLGSIELSKQIRESCDKKVPIVLTNENVRKSFEIILTNLTEYLLKK